MKHLLAFAALITSLCPLAITQSNSPSANVQDEVRKMEQRWLDAAAVPDLPTLRSMFASNFIGTAFGPQVLSKEDVVPPDDNPGSNHLPKSTLKDSTVRVFGDTAVLVGDVQPEDPKQAGLRVTTVFQRQAQGWQIIAIHMSAAKH